MQVLQIVNLYKALSLLQSNVEELCVGANERSVTSRSSICESIIEQLQVRLLCHFYSDLLSITQIVAETLQKVASSNEQTEDAPTSVMFRPHRTVPHQYLVMLQEMKFVHLLALLISNYDTALDRGTLTLEIYLRPT